MSWQRWCYHTNLSRERRFGRESTPRWRVILYKAGRKSARALSSSHTVVVSVLIMRSFAIPTLRNTLGELSTESSRVPRFSATMDPPLRREHYFLLPGRMRHPGERLYRWTFQFLGSIANYEIALVGLSVSSNRIYR